MTLVLQQSSALTLESLERQEKAERKKTLGYFLSELRKRADLEPGFEALLDDFLERRNILVHRLADVPGWSLENDVGLAATNAFVQDMLRVTDTVLKVFMGLVRAWEEQTGIRPTEVEGHRFFTAIDATYKPMVDEIFFRKSDQA